MYLHIFYAIDQFMYSLQFMNSSTHQPHSLVVTASEIHLNIHSCRGQKTKELHANSGTVSLYLLILQQVNLNVTNLMLFKARLT